MREGGGMTEDGTGLCRLAFRGLWGREWWNSHDRRTGRSSSLTGSDDHLPFPSQDKDQYNHQEEDEHQ